MPMDLKNQRRSTHIEDDRLSPFWEDYNKSFLADLFGPHRPPWRGGRIYMDGPQQGLDVPPDAQMAIDAGVNDDWMDQTAGDLVTGRGY